MNRQEYDYDWFTPRAMRKILEPLRGKPIPASIMRYWRKVLGITASKGTYTEGLYSKEDLQILAGGIVWMESNRPLKLYARLIDEGYRIAEVVPDIQDTLKLIDIKELEEIATQ